uniref:Uncharacterized protein n=1 Tax=Arundo donax TaxID=35708 RepID=A0A0A9EJG7_ARUDO
MQIHLFYIYRMIITGVLRYFSGFVYNHLKLAKLDSF